MNARARSLVAMFGALVYALVGVRILLSSSASVLVNAREYVGHVNGSGGIGAVSIGVSDILLLYGLLWVASIVAHWMLRAWARGSDRAIRGLYRTHLWMLVLPFVLVLLVPVTFLTRLAAVSQQLFSISGLAWGLQFVLTAALLGMYAARIARRF